MKGNSEDPPVDLVAVAADDELITRLSAGAVLDSSTDPLTRLMAEWVAETRRGELGSCRCGHSPDALPRSEPVGRSTWWILRWARRRRRGKRGT